MCAAINGRSAVLWLCWSFGVPCMDGMQRAVIAIVQSQVRELTDLRRSCLLLLRSAGRCWGADGLSASRSRCQTATRMLSPPTARPGLYSSSAMLPWSRRGSIFNTGGERSVPQTYMSHSAQAIATVSPTPAAADRATSLVWCETCRGPRVPFLGGCRVQNSARLRSNAVKSGE